MVIAPLLEKISTIFQNFWNFFAIARDRFLCNPCVNRFKIEQKIIGEIYKGYLKFVLLGSSIMLLCMLNKNLVLWE